ncbi:hypothetical protein D3C75_973220 [compost metagenome]
MNGELCHRLQLLEQRRLVLIVVRQHTGPQIGPDGVVATDVRLDGVRLPAFAHLPHHPVRQEAVRGRLQP